MSAEEFNKCYEQLRSVSPDSESLKKVNKPELIEKLSSALVALKCAEAAIFKQSDALVSLTQEFLKKNNKSEVNNSSNFGVKEQTTFAEVIKQPPAIILKPKTGNGSFDKGSIENKFKNALKTVNVKNARITGNGNIIVNVPNEENYQKATNGLQNVFSEDFSFENPKKILPKLALLNVPKYMDDSSIISSMCEKDAEIKKMVEHGEFCTVVRSWDMKAINVGQNDHKTVVLKCSAKIRNYIVNVNDGYVYFNLVRCRALDRFFITQCYHCCGFHHIAKNCPDKSKSSVCGRCSGSHNTKNCSLETEKCVNCTKFRPSQKNDHSSFSPACPLLVHEKSMLMKKTDFGDKKN